MSKNIKNPLDSIDIVFENNIEKEIKLNFNEIINYELKECGFLKNNKSININKIKTQYNQDKKRKTAFIKDQTKIEEFIEKHTKLLNNKLLNNKLFSEYLVDQELLINSTQIPLVFLSTQGFVGFFYYTLIKNINLNQIQDYNSDYNLIFKDISNNRFSYFIDESKTKITITKQIYDLILINNDNKRDKILTFEYNYNININDNSLIIKYKFNWNNNNNNNNIIKLLEITYLLNKKDKDWYSNFFKDLEKYYEIIKTDDNLYNKIDFFNNCYRTIYNNYEKKKEDILKTIKEQIYEQYKFKKDFLIINFDEEQKNFINNNLDYLSVNIEIQKPSFIIVCTQNCKTSGNEHFQHVFKKNLEEYGYNMIIKNSKLKNIKSRIYYKNNSEISIKEKKIIELNDKKYGNGLIIISLLIIYRTQEFKFIFVNCNLKENKENEFTEVLRYISSNYLKYNIFICENFNFNLNNCKNSKYINSTNLLLKYNKSNKKNFGNYINGCDTLYNFIEGIKIMTSNINKKQIYDNFLESIKELGIDIIYNDINILKLNKYIRDYEEKYFENYKNNINKLKNYKKQNNKMIKRISNNQEINNNIKKQNNKIIKRIDNNKEINENIKEQKKINININEAIKFNINKIKSIYILIKILKNKKFIKTILNINKEHKDNFIKCITKLYNNIPMNFKNNIIKQINTKNILKTTNYDFFIEVINKYFDNDETINKYIIDLIEKINKNNPPKNIMNETYINFIDKLLRYIYDNYIIKLKEIIIKNRIFFSLKEFYVGNTNSIKEKQCNNFQTKILNDCRTLCFNIYKKNIEELKRIGN